MAAQQETEDLKLALERGDINGIDEIFSRNPPLVYAPSLGSYRETPLGFALRRDLQPVVEHLLSPQYLDQNLFDHRDHWGFQPIHRATRRSWVRGDLFDKLFNGTSHASLVSKTEDGGDTVLHLASREGRVAMLDVLCPELSEDEINSLNNAGNPAIHEGVHSWNVVLCLLQHGASLFTNSRGDTLLHAVVATHMISSNQGTETRRALLTGTAERARVAGSGNLGDLGAQNKDKNTPLHVVVGMLNGLSDHNGTAFTVLKEFLRHGSAASQGTPRSTPLRTALLETNNAGDTVLHLIASQKLDDSQLKQRRAIQAMKKVVSVSRDLLIKKKPPTGNTPLHMACVDGNWVMVEALLEADKSVGIEEDEESESEESYGAESEEDEEPESEGDEEAEPREDEETEPQAVPTPYGIANCKNDEGDIPLHLAIRGGHLETVKKLMADRLSSQTLLIRDGSKDTSLHLAARHGKPDILRELLSGTTYERLAFSDKPEELRGRAGISDKPGNLRGRDGMTPLIVAAGGGTKYEETGVFEQILQGCSGPELLNETEPKSRQSALHYAASKGFDRIVELLLLNGADSKNTDHENRLPADVALQNGHVDIADFITQYRPRRFRLRLQADKANKEVDTHFLALVWPKWDKKVRHQPGEPPRMWPRATSAYQLIYEAVDTYWEDPDTESYRRYPGSIYLAPIHQAQIHLDSCEREGWTVEERKGFGTFDAPRNVQDAPENDYKAYLYDPAVFEGNKRSTRWIHLSANNKTWIEDLCRCMYSHGSLRSELLGILRFIEDNFEEVDGSQRDRYRKHNFISQVLENITDPPMFRRGVVRQQEADFRHEPASSVSRRRQQPGDEDEPGEEGTLKSIGDKYSAYSAVFPLLDMDFMHPGFCQSTSPAPNPPVKDVQRDPSAANVKEISETVLPAPASPQTPAVDASQGNPGNAGGIHCERMTALGKRKGVHPSRSLDHYCHTRISENELLGRVRSQVFTRFMARLLSRDLDKSTINKDDEPPKSFFSQFWDPIKKLLRSGPEHAHMEAGIIPRQKKDAVHIIGKTASDAECAESKMCDSRPPLQILVVPQLWLWKFDNLIITSFPQRWDCTYQRRGLLNDIREKIEYLNVDREVEPDRVVIEILNACAQFQPSLNVNGQDFTWTDAFDDEILRVSRNIKNCYRDFKENLGKSDEAFSKAFRHPTMYLEAIDDVLDELTCIKRVFQDQMHVWEKVHTGEQSCVVCKGLRVDGENPTVCGSDMLPKRSFELALRLEEDALKVRESVVTLLTLLQGEASTENTLRASDQSRILAVFTVITVVFTPLSWVTSLFALEIQSFPATWAMKDLGLGSFITLLVTLLICALSWRLWMLFYRSLFWNEAEHEKKNR